MERLLVTTANFPKHGQPGETSGEDSVKTPWTWDQNEASMAGNDSTKKASFHQREWDGTDKREGSRIQTKKSDRRDGHLRGYR